MSKQNQPKPTPKPDKRGTPTSPPPKKGGTPSSPPPKTTPKK